jgi:two-component system, OmpR family, sensor histidine kinase KdpD
LRTPLAVLVGASSSLVDNDARLSDAAKVELAATIHDESRRMTVLVNNLLDMARLESGKAVLSRQWTSLEELIGGVLTRLRDAQAEHPIAVALPHDLPLLRVDAVLIEQVLANLLENAAKYTPAHSPIEVSAQVLAGRIAIEVADRGPGIPAGEEVRVFDKFHRVHPESAQSGVGLGLAIAKAIVIAHGGSITAANRAGGGAVFRVELPADPPPAVDEELGTPSAMAGS